MDKIIYGLMDDYQDLVGKFLYDMDEGKKG